jgi:hypothetical protein
MPANIPEHAGAVDDIFGGSPVEVYIYPSTVHHPALVSCQGLDSTQTYSPAGARLMAELLTRAADRAEALK